MEDKLERPFKSLGQLEEGLTTEAEAELRVVDFCVLMEQFENLSTALIGQSEVVLDDLDSVLVSVRAHWVLTCISCKRLENDLAGRLPGGEVILSFGRVSERVSRDLDFQRAISDPREQVLEGERNLLKAALQRVATKRDILFEEMAGELTGGGSS